MILILVPRDGRVELAVTAVGDFRRCQSSASRSSRSSAIPANAEWKSSGLEEDALHQWTVGTRSVCRTRPLVARLPASATGSDRALVLQAEGSAK